MNGAQKTIKYGALAFAFLLIIFIISSMIGALSFVAGIFDYSTSPSKELQRVELNTTSNIYNIEKLDVDLGAANIIIKPSDKLDVLANDVKVKVDGKTLKIYDDRIILFGGNRYSEVILYLPEDMIFEEAKFDLGAGKAEINDLVTDKLDVDAGAGVVKINNIRVNKKAKIDGGMGNFVINNGSIANLDLETGMGNTEISAHLTGKNDIECGMGNVVLDLLDSLDNYRISVDKGLGSAKINGNSVSSGTVMGTGNTIVDIECGAGSMNVTTK